MRTLRVLAALVVAISLAAAAHVAHAFTQPAGGSDRVAAQVRWLNGQRTAGAAAGMQQLFPEGEFFTHLLTGLAAASLDDTATVEAALRDTAEPTVRARFGTIAELDGGTFYRGWRLLLLTEQARLSGRGADALLAEARAVQDALTGAPTGVPASYPGGYWPCDAVVAMAAVVRARVAAGAPIEPGTLAAWRDRLTVLNDQATGLLPHRIAADGGILDGVRGSSQSIIQTFWPDVDPAGAGRQWQRFVATLVVREAGLVGVREYPGGADAPADVDSGPLLWGVSASASAVTLAAARRNGAAELAGDLDRQAEYLGAPLEWSGERRFVFGLLPVGDAFVAWARSVAPAAPAALADPPRALWGWHLLAAALPGIAAGAWLVRRSRVSSCCAAGSGS